MSDCTFVDHLCIPKSARFSQSCLLLSSPHGRVARRCSLPSQTCDNHASTAVARYNGTFFICVFTNENEYEYEYETTDK
jgi:hypothetical protein